MIIVIKILISCLYFYLGEISLASLGRGEGRAPPNDPPNDPPPKKKPRVSGGGSSSSSSSDNMQTQQVKVHSSNIFIISNLLLQASVLSAFKLLILSLESIPGLIERTKAHDLFNWLMAKSWKDKLRSSRDFA